MEENVLKDFATFSEFPDMYLEVSSNSNYYYIKKPLEAFVAKRKIDLVTPIKIYNKEKILQKKSYYDVNDGNLVLKTESLINLDGSNEEFIKKEKNTKIISLSSILEIAGEEKKYLSKNQVKKIISSEKSKSKVYTRTQKKY